MILQHTSTNIFCYFILLTLAVTGCTQDSSMHTIPDKDQVEEISFRSSDFLFSTTLRGSNEVPAVPTGAFGKAVVSIAEDESHILYRVSVGNIENVVAAHFHVGVTGQNGPVVVPIYSNPNQPSGNELGVLTEGIITAGNVGSPLAGSLSNLIDRIRTGGIYINVHSTNYPSGEIRGQL